MSEHVLHTLELVKGQVRDLESQLAEKKRFANSLCELAKVPLLYATTEPEQQGICLPTRGDEYYGQAMSPAIRMILEARQSANLGPATVNEIHEGLRAGGYQFDAANEANEKKSVRICLTKNSSIFHRLPTGKFGLTKWYPKVRTAKKSGAESQADEVADEDEGREVMEVEFGSKNAPEPSTAKKEVKLLESSKNSA